MTPFLKQVAQHYHPASEISRMCFIFPNKRAIAFFRKYLGELSAAQGRAIISPETLTINDFFSRLSPLRTADRISSLVTLYDCYKELYPAAEPLDEFVFWGGVLLSDFSEVDKYRVNPSHIFKNVADFRRMQDSLDYLDAGQKEAMERFLGQFAKDGDYKERFRRIWDILLPLYESFNSRMESGGLATEGRIYRLLAERLDTESAADVLKGAFPDTEKFVFVGLNALNECEKKVLRKMRDAHLAEFCWDFSSAEIRDPANRSSFFLSQNSSEFPQAFIPDPEGLQRPVVNVVSVPSSSGQAKLLPSIFDTLSLPADTPPEGRNTRGSIAGGPSRRDGGVSPEGELPKGAYPPEGVVLEAIGINTAVVLPDEGLLLSVLNSIPESIEDVNVTMGYPMRGSEFSALLEDIAALQLNLREKNGRTAFYHRHVWGIFSNSLLRCLVGENGGKIISRIRREARYYIDESAFRGDPVLELIFRPATDIPSYLKDLITGIAPLLKEKEGKEMELDFAMFAYKAVTRLQDLAPDVQPRTWWKLFDQLVTRSSVPFTGEPLKGLQIMGPLETRALDFENVIILSCNEGMFPRRSVASSFIPAELRKGFGLPTYEYQDSVWAYYFYRLIQRARNVWLLFDSRTEMSRTGEESRYIRQLQMLYGFDVRRFAVNAPLGDRKESCPIPKTDDDLAIMRKKDFRLSASALQDYLTCPAKFYFSKIKGLKAADEVNESLDAGMLGTVFHETMKTLYSGRGSIGKSYLEELLAGEARIRGIISANIMKQLHTDEVEGRNLIFEDIVLKYVLQVLRTDREMLEKHHRTDFSILGLELELTKRLGDFVFHGYIDRLDSIEPGTVRVVDYKTGRVTEQDVKVDDYNAQAVVDALFGNDNAKRPKIALQLYVYDELLSDGLEKKGLQLENCIYQTSEIFVKSPESVPASREFRSLMRERLSGLTAELLDKSVPWNRTPDTKPCEYCNFKTICGR